MNIERKVIAIEIKAVNDELRQITGYANVKNVCDLGGDITVDGCYAELDSLVKDGWGAICHDWDDLPIAMILDAKEDAHGLLFTMQFHSTDCGQEAYTVAKERHAAGKSVSFSIGYWVIDSAWETRDGVEVRILKSIKVVEISMVNMAMNPLSTATGVKSGSLLAKQFDVLLAGTKDFISRIAWLKENRKQGLKETNRERLAELREEASKALAAIDDLLAESETKAADADVLAFLSQAQTVGIVPKGT